MAKNLKKLNGFAGVEGPVVTIVMDGIGIAPAHNLTKEFVCRSKVKMCKVGFCSA